jgi:hypothetical protein
MRLRLLCLTYYPVCILICCIRGICLEWIIMCFTLGSLPILGAGGRAVLILKGRPLLCKRNKAHKCFMTKIFFQVFNLNLQNIRNFQQHSIWFLATCFFTKNFSEIPRNFKKILVRNFMKCFFYEISRNILAKFRKIIALNAFSRNILAKFREIILKFRKINFNFA